MKSQNEYVVLDCLKVTQPIGTFYVGVMEAKDLIYISVADVREMRNDLDRYMGIQRNLVPKRVKELREYVGLIDATFPTSVILAIPSYEENLEDDDPTESSPLILYDGKKKTLSIRKSEDIAKIIDGQHRIAGLENFKGETFQINVAIFVDMDIEDQAMVFATINLQQVKVSKSLGYDLFEYAKSRSPQKTCHNIAKLLDGRADSPFEGRIKLLGHAEGPNETITQATFISRLIRYISTKPMDDRDRLKRGKSIEPAKGNQIERLIFRELFRKKKDASIAKNVSNFFTAVQEKWPVWKVASAGNILNRSTGFGALMRILRPSYLHLKDDSDVVKVSAFLRLLNKSKIKSEDFSPENFKPGSSGEGKLYRKLLEELNLH